jgi:DNA repair photolyase
VQASSLSPILPGLTDDDEHLEAVIAGAKEYGADFVKGNVLRLGPGITEYYLPFLQKEFPELRQRYEQLYRRNYAPTEYADMVQARVQALKEKHGMNGEFTLPAKERPIAPPLPLQLNLFTKQTSRPRA